MNDESLTSGRIKSQNGRNITDLSTRILAEIERREDHAGQMSYYEVPWAERETGYLGALREIVELHRPDPHSFGADCRYDNEDWPCPTIAAVAAALGVTP